MSRLVIHRATWLSALLLMALNAFAVQHDHDSPANVDARSAAPVALTPAQAAGVTRLQGRAAGVRVELDRVLGRPGFVTRRDGFLTGPNGDGAMIPKAALNAIPPADPHRVVKAFLNEHRDVFGHDSTALAGAVVKRDYVEKHNGLRTTVWEQKLAGIPVFEAVILAHVTKHGELVNLSSRFIADPAKANGPAVPAITAAAALISAALSLNVTLAAANITTAGPASGADQAQHFQAAGLAGDAVVKLVWLPMNGTSLRLCWDVLLTLKIRGETFRTLVEAQTGAVQVRRCLTTYISNASYRVFTGDSPTPFSPGHSTPQSTQPAVVARELVTIDALNTNASPEGWIPDGTNETLGNNVDAHTDRNFDNLPDLPRPHGSPDRVFDSPLDLAQSPATYGDAAVTQLFYWCNWMHDKLYALGFDEASGNFQTNNYGRGGAGGDALQADAQDGGFNNANMTTPPDGSPPRMQMYLWNYATPNRDGDLDAEIVLHEYTHGLSWRLVGGGAGISAMQTSGMGEGWSDFYALALLSSPGENPDGCYAQGGYASYIPSGSNYYYGIRRYPYSTDMTKNPLTFAHISEVFLNGSIPRNPSFTSPAQLNPSEVHNQGEVWCAVLWEARANLIAKYGFAVGNQLILQLVTDGMKLSPPEPNFLQARDAIIQADVVNSGGTNRNELWAAFAKRGMGFSATSPDSSTTAGVVEAFDNGDDLHVTPDTPLVVSGRQGGPFSPASRTYTLTNAGTASLAWSVIPIQPWLDVSPASGVLAPGALVTVTASLNTAANALGLGSHHETLAFRNTATGAIQARGVTLDVLPTQRVIYFPLDSDPGWTRTGAWAFGHPTGGGGGASGYPDPTNGATGSNVFGVNLSGNYSTTVGAAFTLTSGALNLTGRSNCVLQFQRWLNSDYSLYVQAEIYLSTNGTTWTRVWANGLDMAENAWSKQHYDISALADNQPTVYLRWSYRIIKTFSRAMSGWNIDDVEILATTAPPMANSAAPGVSADTASSLTLTGSAASGNPLTFQILSLPVHGLLSDFNAGTGAVTYTPAHGYAGADSFGFAVNDGFASSPPATVSLTVSALPDADGDGMPDAWELLWFGDTTGGDPALDNDRDGLTNLQEYIAATNPNSAASTFRITDIARSTSGHMTIAWGSTGGVRYRVQFSDTLSGTFTDIVRPVADEIDPAAPGSASAQSFTDDFTFTSGAPAQGSRFYRIKVQP